MAKKKKQNQGFNKVEFVREFIKYIGTQKAYGFLYKKDEFRFSKEFLSKVDKLNITKDSVVVDTENGCTIDCEDTILTGVNKMSGFTSENIYLIRFKNNKITPQSLEPVKKN